MVLDHAPPGIGVLSMGRRVEEHDCAVWWTKKHGCLFMNPHRELRTSTVSKYVPCLTATDIETLKAYISGCCAENVPHDVSLVGMVEKLPTFVIEAIYHSLARRFACSPKDDAGHSTQQAASRTQAGGDTQASDERPAETKVGGVTIEPKYFVEVFAERAGLSRAVVKVGNVEIYAVEIDDKDGRTILNKAVKTHIIGLTKGGSCIGVWFGMPCNTFSPARAGDGKKTGPRHLRSDDPNKVKQPLPYLTQNEKDKVKYANKLYQAMICLIESCIHYKVPWYIGNPRSSKLLLMPEIGKYIKHPDTTLCRYDCCLFGTPYRKSSLVISCGNRIFFTGSLHRKPYKKKCTRT